MFDGRSLRLISFTFSSLSSVPIHKERHQFSLVVLTTGDAMLLHLRSKHLLHNMRWWEMLLLLLLLRLLLAQAHRRRRKMSTPEQLISKVRRVPHAASCVDTRPTHSKHLIRGRRPIRSSTEVQSVHTVHPIDACAAHPKHTGWRNTELRLRIQHAHTVARTTSLERSTREILLWYLVRYVLRLRQGVKTLTSLYAEASICTAAKSETVSASTANKLSRLVRRASAKIRKPGRNTLLWDTLLHGVEVADR